MKTKRLLKTFCLGTSLLLGACAGIPKPQGDACVLFPEKGRKLCYDLAKDFDSNGDLYPNVVGKRVPLTTESINKNVCVDPDSFASLKAFALKHKERCEELQKGQKP